MVAREVYYFDDFGTQNTEKTIEAAKTVALNLGLSYVVVASASGATGVMTAEAFKDTGMKTVVVTEYAGMAEFTEENREKIGKKVGLSSLAHIPSSLQLNPYQSSTVATAVATP